MFHYMWTLHPRHVPIVLVEEKINQNYEKVQKQCEEILNLLEKRLKAHTTFAY